MGLKWVKFGNLLKFSKRETRCPSKMTMDEEIATKPVFSRGSGVLDTEINLKSFMRFLEIKEK